jgi:hypothetical protein
MSWIGLRLTFRCVRNQMTYYLPTSHRFHLYARAYQLGGVPRIEKLVAAVAVPESLVSGRVLSEVGCLAIRAENVVSVRPPVAKVIRALVYIKLELEQFNTFSTIL